MKRICYKLSVLLILAQGPAVYGAELLTGVTRLSCEALLCLSSPARPVACNPALSHYFAIKKFTWPATFAARLRFLNMCPTAAPGLARSVASKAPRKWRAPPLDSAPAPNPGVAPVCCTQECCNLLRQYNDLPVPACCQRDPVYR